MAGLNFYHEIRGCSLAVDITARELGIALDLQWVDMATKTLADGTDYHAVNPKGTVPTLQLPDGQFLSEGSVIMQYLADSEGSGTMLPAPGTIDRLRVLEWNSFIAADLHKGGFMPLFKAQTPDTYRDIAVARICSMMSWIDSVLRSRSYLAADCFTIADAHCYTIAMWGYVHDIPMGWWPSLEAYLERIGARASVKAALRATHEQAAKVSRKL